MEYDNVYSGSICRKEKGKGREREKRERELSVFISTVSLFVVFLFLYIKKLSWPLSIAEACSNKFELSMHKICLQSSCNILWGLL